MSTTDAARERMKDRAYYRGHTEGYDRGMVDQKSMDDARLARAKRRFKEVIFELTEDVEQ
jgi:hypothetical protein